MRRTSGAARPGTWELILMAPQGTERGRRAGESPGTGSGKWNAPPVGLGGAFGSGRRRRAGWGRWGYGEECVPRPILLGVGEDEASPAESVRPRSSRRARRAALPRRAAATA